MPLKAEVVKSKVGIIRVTTKGENNSYQAFGAKTKAKPKNL